MLFKTHRIIALLGPRQCGKTTLAKQFTKYIKEVIFFDLENPETYASFKNPIATFEPLNGLIVIDEVQRMPNLFPVLRFIHDEYKQKKFLLLGSASRDLVQNSSETLAGRIAYIELTPFSYNEVPNMYNLLLRGGYPKSYLANTDENSFIWRKEYIRSYLEQDLNMIGIRINPERLR